VQWLQDSTARCPRSLSPFRANLGADIAVRFNHAAVRFELRGANVT
jgi:hypothetical protein